MKASDLPAWSRLVPVGGLAFLPLLIYIGHPDHDLNRPIPALGVMFPVLLLGCLLCYRPGSSQIRLVHDRETDVIIAVPVALAALWVILAAPYRLNDHYWLWRPDLQSFSLFTIVVIILAFGTRTAVSLLPSIASLAITQLPLTQLLILGDNPHTAAIAATAAGFAGLPLIMTRKILSRRNLISVVLLVVIAGGIGVATKLSAWSPAQGGTFGALAGFGTVFLIKGLPLARPKFPSIAPVPFVGRLSVVALFAGGLILVMAYSLNTASPASRSSHFLPNLGTKVAYATQDGFTMRTSSVNGWFFTLAQARSWAVLLGHPDDGALRWVNAACPEILHMSSNGIDFMVTRFQNPDSFSRYVRVTWYGRTSGHEVFRAGLIAWEGTLANGQSLLPPVAAPNLTSDTRQTVERLIRSAKLSCSIDPLEIEPSLLLTAVRLAAGYSQ